MCTKICEHYVCNHTKLLPNDSNLLCLARWEDGECTIKEEDMPVRIMDKRYACDNCVAKGEDWVEIAAPGGAENMDALGAFMARERLDKKVKQESKCCVM